MRPVTLRTRALAAALAVSGIFTPACAGAQARPEARAAARALDFALPRHRDMVDAARLRFAETLPAVRDEKRAGFVGGDRVPFDVDGHAALADGIWSSEGRFFQQNATPPVAVRRLMFGDFLVRRDGQKGLRFGLDARIAREVTAPGGVMRGAFLGLTHTRTDAQGAGRAGVSTGLYTLRRIGDHLDVAAYTTIGVDLHRGRRTDGRRIRFTALKTTLGGSVSGIVRSGRFEIEPAISAQYGVTMARSEDTILVRDARIDLSPRFGIRLDDRTTEAALRRVDVTPQLVCRRLSLSLPRPVPDCTQGAALHLTGRSRDAATTFRAGIALKREEERSLGATLALSRQF